MVYSQSTTKGDIGEKQKVMYSYHKYNYDSGLKTHPTVEDLEKMKLNETGRQKLGRYRCAVSRHSIQSYVL